MTATTHADRLQAAQEQFQTVKEQAEALRLDPNATPHQVADTQSRCEIARLRLRVAHLEHERHEAEQARGNAVILRLRGTGDAGAARLITTAEPDGHLEVQFQTFTTRDGEWHTTGVVSTTAEGQAVEIR